MKMRNSLYIKNYRNLKELKINSLGMVNLITGKNNTGKSTILEAIALYASKGDLALIYDFLNERGEYPKRLENNQDATEANIKALSSLFTNRMVGFDKEDAIIIDFIESNSIYNLFEEDILHNSLSIRFVKYVKEIVGIDAKELFKDSIFTRKRALTENDSQFKDSKIGIEIKIGINHHIVSMEDNRPRRFELRGVGLEENYQFIRTGNIGEETNGYLFDAIALTEKEQFVIDALKIIEPTIERIAFIRENSRERTVVVKLANLATPLPLRSMGDGINRILTIILALVNAVDGFLLIDEFENGLHYTVQEKLWKIIFTLARKLKIQVFVTTHSEDCIVGFEKILNNTENKFDGKLIRLDNIDGKIQQVEFDANDLRIATNQNIEIR